MVYGPFTFNVTEEAKAEGQMESKWQVGRLKPSSTDGLALCIYNPAFIGIYQGSPH